MAIKDDITVVAGKPTFPAADVETKSTIKHATTGTNCQTYSEVAHSGTIN